jgi:hypothetical protein
MLLRYISQLLLLMATTLSVGCLLSLTRHNIA